MISHSRGSRAEHQSRQSLLQAASGVGRRSCTDAAHGRAASGIPLRWRAHAAGAAGCRGEQGGPASCENADAADGDGNGLSQAEYLQARARPQDLSVSAAWPCDRSAEPGVGAITYVPMAGGFIYLAAVMDWFTPAS